MRRIMFAVMAVLVATAAGTLEAAAVECATGDSAVCLSLPNCHWDGEHRGCYPGPGEKRDACAVHDDKGICEADVTLGCAWSDQNKCETKSN